MSAWVELVQGHPEACVALVVVLGGAVVLWIMAIRGEGRK